MHKRLTLNPTRLSTMATTNPAAASVPQRKYIPVGPRCRVRALRRRNAAVSGHGADSQGGFQGMVRGGRLGPLDALDAVIEERWPSIFSFLRRRVPRRDGRTRRCASVR
jgi:hypothetical protein